MWWKTPGMHYAGWKTALSFARTAYYLLLQLIGCAPKPLCWLQTAPITVPNSTGLSLSASPACWLCLEQIASLQGAPRPCEDLQNMSEAAHLHGRQWPRLPRQILQVFEAVVDVTSIPRAQRAAFVMRDGFERDLLPLGGPMWFEFLNQIKLVSGKRQMLTSYFFVCEIKQWLDNNI